MVLKVKDFFVTEIISHVQATYKAYISFAKQLAEQKLFFYVNKTSTDLAKGHATHAVQISRMLLL